MTKNQQLAYLAGIIDGEGYIQISPGGEIRSKYGIRHHQIGLGCTMVRPEVIYILQEAFGGKVRRVNPKKEKRHVHSPQFVWIIRSKLAAAAIARIRPFLILKTKQADLALAFQKTMRAGKARFHVVPEKM